jgi:hypothetical protein
VFSCSAEITTADDGANQFFLGGLTYSGENFGSPARERDASFRLHHSSTKIEVLTEMSDIVKPRFLKFVNKHDEVYVFNANGSPEW